MTHIFKNFGIAIWIFIRGCCSYFWQHCSFRNVFSLSGLLKILFLYTSAVVWVIFLNFDLPSSINRNGTTIAVYTTERIGEKLLHDRIKIAAKNNGWTVVSACFEESILNVNILKPVYYTAASLVNIIFKTKFNLAVTHYVTLLPYGHNVVYLNVPNNMLFNVDGHFKKRYSHLAYYDAYIDLYSVLHGSNPMLMKALTGLKKTNAPVIPLYLAQNRVDYNKARREQILVVGTMWGCNRDSLRMQLALKSLAQDNLLVAYGAKDAFEFLGEKYKGFVEDFALGSNHEKLIQLQKHYGISLVIHNLEHMIAGMPTSRVAESIAAGAIIISDRHPFIEKYFGDNVLYFDALTSEDKIYSQIKSHAEWVIANPERVEEMAKASYDILMSQFALEEQIKKLNNMLNFSCNNS
jgi:hypothetical protein